MELYEVFPSPLEVDRFLYQPASVTITSDQTCFRPLSRWIGSYTENKNDKNNCYICFRPLSRWIGCSTQWSYVINQDFLKFPASLEVDRFLYYI